ncbi:carboxypeptidase-like regulatory domain-containing protein [uncultured Acetobacteroides sp.]|uniref:carboxypeptidase-like regulatory domain-containing protein n=1 Tax=uncultured Acetobacteroides sp. TaxID=1760811 RepID=UPI0029F54780|nr:carboxypeptidase-like regulatory domain-containing protein [uncultured Acetobacteroides sp.]
MRNLVKRMLQIGMIVVLVASFGFAYGQNGSYTTVYGIVKDANTRNAVAFANISIPNGNIGTVTNSEGEFLIKVPKSLNASELEISHVGYKNSTLKIEESNGKPGVYFIEPHVLSLQEIIVRPESPDMLVRMAISDISKNYAIAPAMMEGFYRETIKQRRDYLSVSEAVVDIYKTSYTSYDNDRVRVEKGRKGTNIKKADTLLVKLQGGPSVALLLDVVKNPDYLFSVESLRDYKYEMSGVVNINNKLNYIISFSPAYEQPYPLFFGKFYINQETLALTMAEFSMDISDKAKAESFFIKKKPIGLKMVPTATSYLVSYKTGPDGKYYVNYVRNEMKFKADWKKRWFNSYYTVMSEMAITNISKANVAKIPFDETFKTNMVLNDRIQDLQDQNFWGESNIIEPEQSIENAIRKIAKYMQKNNN